MNVTHTDLPSATTWRTRDQLVPILLVVVFTTVITGWFNLSEGLPTPLAILAGAVWGAFVGVIGTWIGSKARAGAWAEDAFVYLGTIALALAGCGGLMAILLLNGALDSSSVTGETLQSTFLPSIPYYITVNSILEILLIPGVIALSWHSSNRRRVLILLAASLYFAMRVWTYLAFVPARLAWAESHQATKALDDAARRQAADDLMLNDPRWLLLLVMLAIFLVAAHLSRVREHKAHATSGCRTCRPAS